MKKAIATALTLLLTSCGYVLVDQKLVDRVTTLESQVEELQAGQDIQPTADEWDVPCYNDLPCSFVSENGEYVITITSIEAHCKKMRSSRISVQKSERNKKKILKKSIGSSKIVVADTTKKEWHLCSILMISKLNLKVKAFDAVTLESARKETKP